jgi:hypothetical protein
MPGVPGVPLIILSAAGSIWCHGFHLAYSLKSAYPLHYIIDRFFYKHCFFNVVTPGKKGGYYQQDNDQSDKNINNDHDSSFAVR